MVGNPYLGITSGLLVIRERIASRSEFIQDFCRKSLLHECALLLD
jgi:hypothetical protein